MFRFIFVIMVKIFYYMLFVKKFVIFKQKYTNKKKIHLW